MTIEIGQILYKLLVNLSTTTTPNFIPTTSLITYQYDLENLNPREGLRKRKEVIVGG